MENLGLIVLKIEAPRAESKFLTLGLGSYLIGSARNCDIPLQFPTISKLHGRLLVEDKVVSYLDLNSRNGSYLGQNPDRLPSETLVAWPSQDPLGLGPFSLNWHWASEDSKGDSHEQLLSSIGLHYGRLVNQDPLRAFQQIDSELNRKAKNLSSEEKQGILDTVYHEFHGDGPIRKLLDQEACKEILINAHDSIYVDQGKGLQKTELRFFTRQTYEAWIARTANRVGRRLDLQHPICEATLENGARLHAVLPPLTAREISVTIRRFGSAPRTEDQALTSGWLDENSLRILKNAVAQKKNIVISGGTSTGKTSLLNFLCAYFSPEERIITIEDTLELKPPLQNLIQLQSRKPSAEGIGEVTLRQLVQCSLRMRPDRIIMGECRGAEVLEMLQALNTGHPGSLTTVHANSPEQALQRLELLALLGSANLTTASIQEWIRSSIDLIVQVDRKNSNGSRYVSRICLISKTEVSVIYERPHSSP
ncbi:MAG: ATPase, T2SS/T4P/T4SS family [Bdellovibrionota bacterium]